MVSQRSSRLLCSASCNRFALSGSVSNLCFFKSRYCASLGCSRRRFEERGELLDRDLQVLAPSATCDSQSMITDEPELDEVAGKPDSIAVIKEVCIRHSTRRVMGDELEQYGFTLRVLLVFPDSGGRYAEGRQVGPATIGLISRTDRCLVYFLLYHHSNRLLATWEVIVAAQLYPLGERRNQVCRSLSCILM